MTDDEYDHWCEYHASTFGLTGPASGQMFLSWRRLFERLGFDAVSLEEATFHLASKVHPQRPAEHLAAIVRFVQDRRAIVYREQADGFEDRGTCARCGGSGFVVVPALGAIRGGQWVPMVRTRATPSWYTMAVFCGCALGQWKANRYGAAEKRPLRLHEYEARNPVWQQQLQNRHEQQLAEIAASPSDPKADEVYQKLLRVLCSNGSDTNPTEHALS